MFVTSGPRRKSGAEFEDSAILATLQEGIDQGLRDLTLVAFLLNRHGTDGPYRIYRAALHYSGEPRGGSLRDARVSWDMAMLLRTTVAMACAEPLQDGTRLRVSLK